MVIKKLLFSFYIESCIGQRHNGKNWWIMVDFKLLAAVIHKKQDRCDSNFARPYLQGMFYHVINFFPFGIFISVFRTAIIHQQLVAMLRGHMSFVFTFSKLTYKVLLQEIFFVT